jgi:amino acid transporter
MKKESQPKRTSRKAKPVVASAPVPERTGEQSEFVGNTYDLVSLAGVIVSGMLLFSCVTGNYGFCCLPPLAITLGAIGLLSAERARDPRRTRIMSLIGIGGGSLVLLLILAAIVLYICLVVAVIVVENLT